MATKETAGKHRWRFFRAGGVDQVRIESGADIRNLRSLDQKLWVALSCPVKGLEFDEKTLAVLDTDGDARVRVPEILSAIDWMEGVFVSFDDLVKGTVDLPLAALDESKAEGKRIKASALHVLEGLGKQGATSISVADTMETAVFFSKARFNGDGIVPPESVEDPKTKEVAAAIVATYGGEKDRSGAQGVSEKALEDFFAELAAFDAWWKKSEAEAKTVLPLGEGTAAAHAALLAVRGKIDDYFGRCRLALFDPRAQDALNREEKAYLDIAAGDLSIDAQEIRGFPLARIEPKAALPLVDGLNPAWESAVGRFRDLVVAPLLGKDRQTLGESDWIALGKRFDAFAAWQAEKAGVAVEKLGIVKVREFLSGNAKTRIGNLIASDKAVQSEVDTIAAVEKAARLFRDMHSLLVNFVSFADFYSRKEKAVFQAGTLYLDSRSCDLCVRVADPGKHGSLAALAKTYLAYCDLSRPSGEKMTVAAAFTAGDSDHLIVGRNGLFYDRKGRDWDATITKIVENPISIGQAFFAPYKRLLRWIEEQVAKRAAAADSAASDKLTGAVSAAEQSAKTGKGPEQKPKFDIGVVAALGVAVGGITAALGALLDSFFGLGRWMPLGVVAMVLLISGPSMVIAWLKLRQRNLGPILDANGWAVNGRMKLNIPLGAALTSTAALPAGAERSLVDPFAEKKSPWPRILIVLVILGLVGWGTYKTGHLQKGYEWVKAKIFSEKVEAKPVLKPEPAPEVK